MNTANRNAWTSRTGHDTLLNGGLIAAGLAALLLNMLDAPAPNANAPQVAQADHTSGLILSEAKRA